MKAINIKLATVSFAALLMASCSDSSDNGGLNNPTSNTTIVGNAVTSITDAATLASRVHNYKVTNTTSKARSRAAYDSSWDGKTLPEGIVTLTNANDVFNPSCNVFLIPAGAEIKGGINLTPWKNNQNTPVVIYVAGTWDASSEGGYYGIGEIRILKGGTFKAFNNKEALGKNKVINYGTIVLPANQQKITINGTNTLWDNHGSLNIADKDLEVDGGATLNVTGTLNVKNLQITNSKLYSGCAVNVSNNVYMSNGSEFNVMYMHCKNLKQDSGSKMVVKDQSMVECDDLFMNLNDAINQGTYYTLSDKDGVCVIKAARIAFTAPGPDSNNDIKCEMFRTPGSFGTFIVDVDKNKIYGVVDDLEHLSVKVA